VAQLTECNIETIRYYEREELLIPPPRTAGGHRVYNDPMIRRLVFIRRSRELGFSLNEVRQLLSVVDGEIVSCEKVKSIADNHLVDIKTRISDLQKMKKTLETISQECSGNDVPDCPIIDALQG